MNLLKSIYISLYFTAGVLIACHATYQVFTYGFTLDWIGVLIISMPIVMYLLYIYVLMTEPRTNTHLPQLMVPGIVGLLITTYGGLQSGTLLPFAYAVSLGVIGNLLYIYWYSFSPIPQTPELAVGKTLPNFELVDTEGKPFRPEDMIEKYTLFMFFRGNWCPLCMAQIREVSRNYRELAERGGQIMLISPQPDSNTYKLSQRFDVPMRFFRDAHSQLAKRLGILQANGVPMGMDIFGYDRDAPYPTMVLCDKNRKIIWMEVSTSYRMRPNPKAFIQMIDQDHAARQRMQPAG